jgi:hypothetical protein
MEHYETVRKLEEETKKELVRRIRVKIIKVKNLMK